MRYNGMKRMAGMIAAVAMTAFMACPAMAQETSTDAAEIVARVKTTLDSLRTLTCGFEHVQYMAEADMTRRIAGNMWVEPPDFLRVEYPAQTIVVDGKVVWVYVPQNRQAQISTFVSGEGSFPSPKTIFEQYAGAGEASFIGVGEVGGRPCAVLGMTSPANPNHQVNVWVDTELWFPVKTVDTAPTGDTLTYVLTDIVLNQPIDPETFVFTVPDGVDIVDLRD